VIRVLSLIFALLIGAVSVWNYVRGDEYASTTLYVSQRSLTNVMECVSNKSGQIKSDLQPFQSCRPGSVGKTSCQIGMTYLSADGQIRLSMQPANGYAAIRIRHNQLLSSSAVEILERCAR
jgi:hypothetical protein